MTDLTDEQKAELAKIASNDISLGAFSGMIFNAIVDKPEVTRTMLEEQISRALKVRVIVRQMAK